MLSLGLRKANNCMDSARLEAAIAELVQRPQEIRKKRGRAIDRVIALLDAGELRVCEPVDGTWVTYAWIKQAILMYFGRLDSVTINAGKDREDGPTFYDKLPLKRDYKSAGARCVPGGIARYGAFLGRGTILMPGFVNIGAYVDAGSMVDTWATVGSCAQIGKNVHLSGGVGIGGVLEPAQARPVIVEDGSFIGSRCIVVEGVHIEREAVLGAGVVLTASTPIIDVRGADPIASKGRIAARSVVIPGTIPKRFAAGEYGVPCALVIGTRTASTDMKTSLTAVLRDYEVAV